MQMGLESVIQSEVSQKEKKKVIINAYMWNSVVVQAVKNLFATWIGNIREPGLIPGEGNDYMFQYSCLENSVGEGAWWAMGLQRVGHD